MNAVAPHRELLARRLHEEHRGRLDKFWSELTPSEREQWFRVARHIERHAPVETIRELS